MAQTRLAVLDGLRGIAVLLVLWYHIWEISWLPAPLPALQFIPETGFAGVDLFFFISGFVIVYPFVKAAFAGESPPGWGAFAYRRAIKILPSYLLSIAVAIAIGYAHFSSFGDAAAAIVSHLLFIHTWWHATYGAINGVLWTLAVEVEFYAVFPLLWMAFSRRPFVTAGLMVLAAQLYRSYAQSCCWSTSTELLIENLPGYLDIFAAGMIAAYLYVRIRDRSNRRTKIAFTVAAAAGFALFAALLENLWAMRTADQWSTAWAIHNRTLVAVAFLLMGLGSLLAIPFWQRALANRVLLFFAVISYNLYLYHQIFARELLAWRFPNYRGADEHLDPHWQLTYTIVAFAVTIAQATLVTYAFERPLLRVPQERWSALVSRLGKTRALADM